MAEDDGTPTLGEEIISWIESNCRVPEGVLVGQPIGLMGWQKREIVRIYDNPQGPTRHAIISVGRKSGKSTLIACLLPVHLVGPAAIPNSQLYSAAQSRDQAALIFSLAAKMVRMSPRLSAAVQITDSGKRLTCPSRGTVYKALSADASTAMGLSPAFVCHDELGQVRVRAVSFTKDPRLESLCAHQYNRLKFQANNSNPPKHRSGVFLLNTTLTGHAG